MKRQKLTRILLASVVAVSLLGPAAWHMGRKNLQAQLLETLATYGFNAPQVGPARFENGNAVFTDLVLDAEGFSTIRAIQVSARFFDILFRQPPKRIVIDDVRLTGDFSDEAGLTVSGWTKRPLPFPSWNHVVLTGGQLDLDTSAGALRFQAKGEGSRQPDGSLKIQGLVWGVQNQIKIDSAISGVLYPGGWWTYDVELKDGGMSFDRIQASRMSGWLTVSKTEAAAPELSGQLDAGRMNIGDLSFTGLNVVFQGPIDNHSIAAKASLHGFEGMQATLDMKYKTGEPNIKAAVETASLDDLLAFLGKLRGSDINTGSLTSLLLTQGNLDRLRREIRQQKQFDMLELQIYGPLDDLTGKIVVKTYKDGTEQRHVISLDPGNG